MTNHNLESELYQVILDSELRDVQPYLDQFELILPDRPIAPLEDFSIVVKASGSDLSCDGSWFQVTLGGQLLTKAETISKPKGGVLSIGVTGEWHLQLKAPAEEGGYWLHTVMNSVEADQSVIKTSFTVKNLPKKVSRSFTWSIISLSFLGTLLSIVVLAYSFNSKAMNQIRERFVNAISGRSTVIQESSTESSDSINLPERNQPVVNDQITAKTVSNTFVDELLEQSLNDPHVFVRYQAWDDLSQLLESPNAIDTATIQKIIRQRALYKQQVEEWIMSNQDSQELIKRLQVLAYVDDDKDAQRWLGNLYQSGKTGNRHLGKAWQWYQRSANKGDIEARNLLEKLEKHAEQLLKSSRLETRIQGYEVAEAAASAGGVNAQLWMGQRYETGDGIDRNYETAMNWYRKAAAQNSVTAKQKLAEIIRLINQQKKTSETR